MDRKQVLHQFEQLYALQPERLSKQVRIEQALRQAITHQWPTGLRLPSHRALAESLGVSRQTLALAVATLLDEALLKNCPWARHLDLQARYGKRVARWQYTAFCTSQASVGWPRRQHDSKRRVCTRHTRHCAVSRCVSGDSSTQA